MVSFCPPCASRTQIHSESTSLQSFTEILDDDLVVYGISGSIKSVSLAAVTVRDGRKDTPFTYVPCPRTNPVPVDALPVLRRLTVTGGTPDAPHILLSKLRDNGEGCASTLEALAIDIGVRVTLCACGVCDVCVLCVCVRVWRV